MELSQTAPIPALLIWRRVPVVTLVVTAVNLLILGLGVLLDVDLRLPDRAGGFTADNLSGARLWLWVLVVSVVAMLAAGVLFSLLLRFGPTGVLWFNVTVTVLAALSLILPLLLPLSVAGTLILISMHLVVWAGAFFGLGRSVLR